MKYQNIPIVNVIANQYNGPDCTSAHKPETSETLATEIISQQQHYSLVSTKNLSQKFPSSSWHPGPGYLGKNGLNSRH